MKRKERILKCVIASISVFTIFLGNANSQPFFQQGLKPGDPIPDVKVLFHRGDSTFTGSLRQFEGKLIIFDFWHIACGGCIHAIPEMWDLQKKFKDKVQIIMVTPNDDSTLARFERKFRSNRREEILAAKDSLLSVVGDTTLLRLFCQRKFPSHVWVDSRQNYMFLTNGSTTSQENIEKLLAGEPVDMWPETNMILDAENPYSWINTSADDSIKPVFFSILTHWINYGKANMQFGLVRDSISNQVIGFSAINTDVLPLFRFAAQVPIELSSRSRLIYDMEDSLKLFRPINYHNYYPWCKENTFCYGLRIPVERGGDIYKIMLQDLEGKLGYRCTIENRNEKCLILKRAANFAEKQASLSLTKIDSTYEEGYLYSNRLKPNDVARWVDDLMENVHEYYPVVDETNYDKKVVVLFPTEYIKSGLKIENMRSFLLRAGFDLEVGNRTIPMLVIKRE